MLAPERPAQTSTPQEREVSRPAVQEVARALEQWGWARSWAGPDPYDGLNATRVPSAVRKSPLGRRIVIQTVKRSPLDVRPLLGVPPGLSAASLGLLLSAYARNGFLEPDEARAKLNRCVELLSELRCSQYPEPSWSYHFDVQTRVFFYSKTTPNTIATAFVGLGLLDAYELAGHREALELATGAGEFFLRRIPQTPDGAGAYFGYLPGDTAAIHNANMLVCALLARLARSLGREDLRRAARSAVAYTLSRQRPDGSWPYGERRDLRWVDSFHTGYVLDCLLTCTECGISSPGSEEAWRRGLHFYATHLIEPDGTPRYTPQSRYPVDGQCAAQAIETLSRAAAREPVLAERRYQVFDYTRARLARGDGAFLFQRRRFWVNRACHPRWVQAPMLRALALLIETTQ